MLENFQPEDPSYFGVWLLALIGEDEAGPADGFDFLLCTPRWLADTFETDVQAFGLDGRRLGHNWSSDGQALFGTGIVLVATWSTEAARRAVEEICEAQQGPDWGSVASRIGRLIPWEYDYRYDHHVNTHPTTPFPPT
jgi:hypothetical protein